MGIDSVEHDFPAFNVVPEVVELDVDVLSAWAHLWDFGDFERTTVVLKDMTIDSWLGGDHVESLALELHD